MGGLGPRFGSSWRLLGPFLGFTSCGWPKSKETNGLSMFSCFQLLVLLGAGFGGPWISFWDLLRSFWEHCRGHWSPKRYQFRAFLKALKPINIRKPFIFWFSWGLALGGLGAPFGASWAHLGSSLGNIGAQDGTRLEPFGSFGGS